MFKRKISYLVWGLLLAVSTTAFADSFGPAYNLYLRRTGALPMTGNLNMGGYSIVGLSTAPVSVIVSTAVYARTASTATYAVTAGNSILFNNKTYSHYVTTTGAQAIAGDLNLIGDLIAQDIRANFLDLVSSATIGTDLVVRGDLYVEGDTYVHNIYEIITYSTHTYTDYLTVASTSSFGNDVSIANTKKVDGRDISADGIILDQLRVDTTTLRVDLTKETTSRIYVDNLIAIDTTTINTNSIDRDNAIAVDTTTLYNLKQDSFTYITEITPGVDISTNLVVDGNIGIGTSNPQALLHLSVGTGGGEGITFTDTAAAVGDKNIRMQFHPTPGGTSPAGIIFQQLDDAGVWASDLVTIRNSGRLGVGLNTPSYKLDVLGDFRTTGSSWLGSSLAGQGLFVNTDGKVGIGKIAPASTLDIVGTLNTSLSVIVGSTLTVQGTAFSVGGNNLVVNGNVVTIGGATPYSNALAVQGQIGATGGVMAGGDVGVNLGNSYLFDASGAGGQEIKQAAGSILIITSNTVAVAISTTTQEVTLSSELNMSDKLITNVSTTPIVSSDVTTKVYVDNSISVATTNAVVPYQLNLGTSSWIAYDSFRFGGNSTGTWYEEIAVATSGVVSGWVGTATSDLNMGSYTLKTSSSIEGLTKIVWADGTVQVSSPVAGGASGGNKDIRIPFYSGSVFNSTTSYNCGLWNTIITDVATYTKFSVVTGSVSASYGYTIELGTASSTANPFVWYENAVNIPVAANTSTMTATISLSVAKGDMIKIGFSEVDASGTGANITSILKED